MRRQADHKRSEASAGLVVSLARANSALKGKILTSRTVRCVQKNTTPTVLAASRIVVCEEEEDDCEPPEGFDG